MVGRKERMAAYAGGGRAGSAPTYSGTPAAAAPPASSSVKCHLGAYTILTTRIRASHVDLSVHMSCGTCPAQGAQ